MAFCFLANDECLQWLIFKTTDNRNGGRDRIGTHREPANGIGLNALCTNSFQNKTCDQQRAPRIERGHSAIKIVGALFARRESEIPDAKRFLPDDVTQFLE